MGLGPTQGDEECLGPATSLHETVVLSFVIPSVADLSRRAVERSAVRLSAAPNVKQRVTLAHVRIFRHNLAIRTGPWLLGENCTSPSTGCNLQLTHRPVRLVNGTVCVRVRIRIRIGDRDPPKRLPCLDAR
jgi:hypothetical protein